MKFSQSRQSIPSRFFFFFTHTHTHTISSSLNNRFPPVKNKRFLPGKRINCLRLISLSKKSQFPPVKRIDFLQSKHCADRMQAINEPATSSATPTCKANQLCEPHGAHLQHPCFRPGSEALRRTQIWQETDRGEGLLSATAKKSTSFFHTEEAACQPQNLTWLQHVYLILSNRLPMHALQV